MTAPAERAFSLYPRGYVREVTLSSMRQGLRALVNPTTGIAFTDDEVRRATMQGSRFWVEADAMDIAGLANQQRDRFLADQARIDRAASPWLISYHGDLWGEAPLPAEGGWGTASATGEAAVVYQGSTTIPDAAAVQATDPSGARYQVVTTATADALGAATLTFFAIDTGTATNIAAGTKLTYSLNKPVGAAATATVDADFIDGVDAETNADFADRLKARIRHKPASGNAAQFRAWLRESHVDVEDGFVYSCGLHAGSVLCVITKKRGTTVGPYARIPVALTPVMEAAQAYVTPPTSGLVPERALVLVIPPRYQDTTIALAIQQPVGSDLGWADQDPWPVWDTARPVTFRPRVQAIITGVSPNVTCFDMYYDGATTPPAAASLMRWDPLTSTWTELAVTSTVINAGFVRVTLSAATTIVVGDHISPLVSSAHRQAIEESIVAYFDTLGPGEIIDLDTDPRADRAFRFPEPSEEWPQECGAGILATLIDDLSPAVSGGELLEVDVALARAVPATPTSPFLGPYMIVPKYVGIYPV